VAGGVVGHDQALDVAGAHVDQVVVAQPLDAPVGVEGQLDPVALVARVDGAQEVLGSALDPLHRPAQAQGEQPDQQLLRVDHGLDPEPAAHVGGDHADGLGGQPGPGGQRPAQPVGRLGGGPHGQPVPVRYGQGAARLDRGAGLPAHLEGAPHHDGGPPEGGVHVALGHGEVRGQVVAPVRVQQWRPRGQGGVDVADHGERVQVQLDQLGPVHGQVGVLGHHGRDRLPGVAHPLVGQHAQQLRAQQRVDRLAQPGAGREPGRVGERPVARPEVGGGHHVHDPRRLAGRVQVDASDQGVGQGAAHDGQMDRVGHGHVVQEHGLAAQDAGILDAPDRLAEQPGRHSPISKVSAPGTLTTSG
jgi:hypothetical protein